MAAPAAGAAVDAEAEEEVELQALEFWSTVAEEELDRSGVRLCLPCVAVSVCACVCLCVCAAGGLLLHWHCLAANAGVCLRQSGRLLMIAREQLPATRS